MASERSHWDRATKIAVVASALGALVYNALHAGRELPFLPIVACLMAAAAAVLAKKYADRTTPLILAIGYVFPALLLLTIGYRYWNLSIWMGAFTAAIAATTPSRWHFPSRLRFPLICWALAIAVTWPIVALRQIDWLPSVLWTRPSTPSAAVYAIPSSVWTAHVALVHLLGLLWMDWLFAHFGRHTRDEVVRFQRVVVLPLLAAATLASLVGVYQGFGDLRFLTIGTWPDLGRASGALADGNASGALSALWVSVALCLAVQARSRGAALLLASCAVLLLVATWVSGSRTALLCALVGVLAVVHVAVTDRVNRRRTLIASGVTIALLISAWIGFAPSVRGPLSRVHEVLPSLSAADLRAAAVTLWERGGYGTTAVMMIKDEPLQGVGVGAFHAQTQAYFKLFTGGSLIYSDNAQNWFRHQLAELGAIGSVGWLWWSALLVAALVSTRMEPASRTSALAAKYTIVGFGLASMLGMPSQNLFVALTVWTFAFWLFLIIDDQTTSAAFTRWPVVAALAIAIVFAAATAYAGRRELRPPFLAKRFDYAYEHGVYQSMDGPAGQLQTTSHGVVVPSAPTATLKLTAWVEHPDADTRPVAVRVWLDGHQIMRGHFPRNVPMTRVVTVPGHNRRFVLETRVDRTYELPATGQRDVGLTLAWEFQPVR